jgi:RNA polymerase sigma-70 factor (ECF subfamily)
MSGADAARETVEAVYRAESRRVLAALIRLPGDFYIAKEAPHDAIPTLSRPRSDASSGAHA